VRFLPVLPAGCAVYWWGGIPYYYYDDAYYTYNSENVGYELSEPPPVSDSSTDTPPDDQLLESLGNAAANAEELYIYPRNGQNDQQTATDRYECHKQAVEQTGFDPTTSGSSGNPADYRRAMISCLEARGYSAQ
jgi:hypothetical protein